MRSSRPYELVDRNAHFVEQCRGRTVLHLGCTNWPYTEQSLAAGTLLHDRLAAVAGELWGFDADADGIAELARLGYGNLVVADLERLDAMPAVELASLPADPDVVVAGDVIEHLSNPGLFLAGVQRLLGPGTRLIISTVNAYCAMRFLQFGLRGRGGASEPVHPDHVAYYSRTTLELLVRRAGLEVVGARYYDLGPEHRPTTRRALQVINDLGVRVGAQLADGVIVECRLPRSG